MYLIWSVPRGKGIICTSQQWEKRVPQERSLKNIMWHPDPSREIRFYCTWKKHNMSRCDVGIGSVDVNSASPMVSISILYIKLCFIQQDQQCQSNIVK